MDPNRNPYTDHDGGGGAADPEVFATEEEAFAAFNKYEEAYLASLDQEDPSE